MNNSKIHLEDKEAIHLDKALLVLKASVNQEVEAVKVVLVTFLKSLKRCLEGILKIVRKLFIRKAKISFLIWRSILWKLLREHKKQFLSIEQMFVPLVREPKPNQELRL